MNRVVQTKIRFLCEGVRSWILVAPAELDEVSEVLQARGIEFETEFDGAMVLIERQIPRRQFTVSNQDPQRVTTGRVRLSYVHLFKPHARPGQEPKLSVTLLIPKTDVATKQRIDVAIQAAIADATQSVWSGVRPPQIAVPIHDGDGVKNDGTPFGDECKGHWVMTASCKPDRRVEIVDSNMNPIIDQTQVYSGMYGMVSIRFFGYYSNGKKGIGCGLGNVMKVADGEPLSASARSAADDFASLAGTAPAPYPGQQPSYGPGGYPAQPGQPQYGGQPQYAPQPGQPQYGQGGYAPQPGQAPYGQPGQPQYGQGGYAPQPGQPQTQYGQPTQPGQQIDPITGQPVNGPIMGL